jgi:hypothetical protein
MINPPLHFFGYGKVTIPYSGGDENTAVKEMTEGVGKMNRITEGTSEQLRVEAAIANNRSSIVAM